jgi:hypothetical protein
MKLNRERTKNKAGNFIWREKDGVFSTPKIITNNCFNRFIILFSNRNC